MKPCTIRRPVSSLSGAWFFLGLEADGMGDTIEWCKYNPFANADVANERRYHAFGGVQTEMKYSVNTNPPSGLDSETVAILGMELEWWSRVSAGVQGVMTTVIGDFTFTGSTGYKEYYDPLRQLLNLLQLHRRSWQRRIPQRD